jgi:hypothetical protein
MSFFEKGDIVTGVDNLVGLEFCQCEVINVFKNGKIRLSVLNTELPEASISYQAGEIVTVYASGVKLISQVKSSSTDDVAMTILKLSGIGEQ